jgi:hypothetical protein
VFFNFFRLKKRFCFLIRDWPYSREFNYGFDTTWDNDAGNLSRVQSIIELIDYLNQLSINEIVEITHDNNLYNQNYILTNKFYNSCHNENLNSIEQVFKVIQN